MNNNIESIVNIIISDKTISETLNKIIAGQYVSDRERKEAIKATIDRWSKI